jgi:dTDP-4-dehydrorhamnose reductase
MGRRVPEVAAISTDEYPTRARRPANSMLNCDKLQKAWGIGPADWRAALARDVQSIIATELGKQESDV